MMSFRRAHLFSIPASRTGRARGRRRRFAPGLVPLEARALLSTLYVTNDGDNPAPGSGSLRGELAAASPGDTIAFKPSAYGTITLSHGPLSVATNVDIDGPGAKLVTVSGGGKSTVFDIENGVTATISGLTVTNGLLGPSGYEAGGGITNDGTLTLSDAVVTGNSAAPGSYGGGGIFNAGTLSISGSTISGNINSDGEGGGIKSIGTLSLSDSQITGNSAIQGGGLQTVGGSLVDCVVSGNAGGGIVVLGSGSLPITTLTITDSAVVDNTNDQTATGYLSLGAGITSFDADVTVTHCTISGNVAEGRQPFGAGIFMGGVTAYPALKVLTLTDSTVSGNRAIGTTDAGLAYGGGIHTDPGVTVSISGTSFVGNTATGLLEAQGGAMVLTGQGTSTITDCRFSGNQAVAKGNATYGGSADGGAIINDGGPLTISGSTFAKNLAQGSSGGGEGVGGAICNFGDVTLSSDAFVGNRAVGGAAGTASSPAFGGFGVGGALADQFEATATVSDCTFIGNTAVGGAATGTGNQAGSGLGGAIAVLFSALTVSDSNFIGNSADGGAGSGGAKGGEGAGGAIQANASDFAISGPALKVSGGSMIGNSAMGGSGGGDGEGGGVAVSSGSATFTDVLIALNAAVGGSGGGKGYGGGLYIATGAITTLKNSEVVLNAATTAGDNIYGTYTNG